MDIMLIKNISWKRIGNYAWKIGLAVFVALSAMLHYQNWELDNTQTRVIITLYDYRIPIACDSIIKENYGTWWLTQTDMAVLASQIGYLTLITRNMYPVARRRLDFYRTYWENRAIKHWSDLINPPDTLSLER